MIINLYFHLIVRKSEKNTFLIRSLEVLYELLHIKLLEQCLEHNMSQILGIVIVLENLREMRTLMNIEKSFINA